MATYTNPISNTSYTNKDFQTIYPELLDLVKELTYRWDPSISNESDPGVILLKLNALVADKNNYAIDKNVLECFPLSVTQQKNARQLFKQLGYTMRWYRSAETSIAFKWIGETNNYSYIIPKFTMVSDIDNSVIYTLVEDGELFGDGSTLSVKALQGIASNLLVGGKQLITASMLDSNNRIYFPDTNVAENGIFITNVNAYNYDSWRPVKNLLVEDSGQFIYEFGIDADEGACYLEFPEDAEDIFSEGINITFLKTEGSHGNIAIRTLEQFYGTVTTTDPVDKSSTISLTTSNVKISNFHAANDGLDPETIDEAYQSYRRTVGTFETLITLRDYVNAIYQSNLVSNVIVSDRTNDIQNAYYTVSDNNSLLDTYRYVDRNATTYYVKNDEGEYVEASSVNDKLQAFDIKLYLFQWVTNPSTIEEYNRMFTLYANNSLERNTVIKYLDDTKSLQHEFNPLQVNKPCFFKNVYPIVATIIPQYKLSQAQANEISTNITNAIYSKLNSHEMIFGKSVEYDDVFDIILNSDNRIKSVIMANIEYTTKMVYLTKNELDIEVFKEVDINEWIKLDKNKKYNSLEETPVEYQLQCDIVAKSILAGKTPYFYKNKDFTYSYKQMATEVVTDIAKIDSDLDLEVTSDDSKMAIEEIVENQNVRFYAPNLLDDVEYSTYILYEYVLTETVRGGTDYQLKGSEYVVLFWKASDDATEYSYYKYVAGDIIKPNFTMTAIVEQGKFGSGLVKGSGLIPSETSSQIQEEYTSSSSHHLSGTKTITSRKLNEVNINPNTHYCYWITNKQVVKNGYTYYTLFSDNQTEVILGEGEYFLYTSASKEELAIVGSGTKLTRTQSIGSWSCKAIDYSSIVSDGLDALTDIWITPPKDDLIKLTEMQAVTIGANMEVRLQLKDTSVTDKFVANFNTDSMNICTYNVSKDFTVTELNLSMLVNSLKNDYGVETLGVGTYDLQYDGTSTYKWSVVYTGKDASMSKLPTQFNSDLASHGITCSGTPTFTTSSHIEVSLNLLTLSDFVVTYKSLLDSEWTSLPQIDLDGFGWEGRSKLLLNLNSENGQVLHKGEKITYYKYNPDTEQYEKIGDIVGNVLNTYIIQSNTNIVSDGGNDIVVSSLNTDGTYSYSKLYIYTETSYVDPLYQTFGPTTAQFHLTKEAFDKPEIDVYETNKIIMPFRFPKHKKFILSVRLPETFDKARINNVKIAYCRDKNFSESDVLGTYLSNITTLTKSGTYYFYIDTDKYYTSDAIFNDNWKICALVNYKKSGIGPAVATQIEFLDIFEIEKLNPVITTGNNVTTPIDGTQEHNLPEIAYLLYKLDYDKKFKFTYEVSEDDLIANPLDADSFLSANHIYNGYTICQFDTKAQTETYRGTYINIINKGK